MGFPRVNGYDGCANTKFFEEWFDETNLLPADFVYPLFVTFGKESSGTDWVDAWAVSMVYRLVGERSG